MNDSFKHPLLLIVALSFLFPVAGWLAAAWVFQPNNVPVGKLPEDLMGTTLFLRTADQVNLPAWYLPGRKDMGGVLLLHCRGCNRRTMLNRARFLNREGYSVLIPDLRGEGEADPVQRGMGIYEVLDVQAALVELRRQIGDAPLAVIGVSKGAAAVVMTNTDVTISALVLESMYGNFIEAVGSRVEEYLGISSADVQWMLAAPLAFGLGVEIRKVSPRGLLQTNPIPKLIMAGKNDNKPSWEQTRQTYEEAMGPKQLYGVPGAGHEDLFNADPAGWEQVVSPFLVRYMNPSKTLESPSSQARPGMTGSPKRRAPTADQTLEPGDVPSF